MLPRSANRKRPRPTSSEEPAPPSTAISALPMELIVAILDLLPLPARLVICSLVCKRWCAAAARTIRRLDASRRWKPSLSAYPCVTDLSLRFHDNGGYVALPQALRKLTVTYSRSIRLGQMFDVYCNVSLQSYLPWLYQLSTSLTKISFALPLGEATPAEQEFLCQTHLLALTHLRFYFSASVDTDLMLEFLRRHAAQLLALELHLTNTKAMTAPPHQMLTFPALRKLLLSRLPCGFMRDLIEGCPLLQRLALYCKFQHDQVLLRMPRVQATLTCVDVPDWDKELKPLLELCPLIRRVPWRLSDPLMSASLLQRIRIASVDGVGSLVNAIAGRHMSQLHELNVYTSTQQLPSEPLDLPNLSKLRVFRQDRIGLSDAMEQVRYLVCSAPHLRHIHLCINLSKLTVYGVDQMLQFLRDMAARGIEEVHLGDAAVESPRLRAVAKTFSWMYVRLGGTEREREATEGDAGAWEQK